MGEVLLAWRGLLGSGVDAILREVPVRLDTSLVSSSDRCKCRCLRVTSRDGHLASRIRTFTPVLPQVVSELPMRYLLIDLLHMAVLVIILRWGPIFIYISQKYIP